METSVVAYETNSTGASVVLPFAVGSATETANANSNVVLVGDTVLAGFSASISGAIVAIGPDFAFANTDGLGFANGGLVFGNTLPSINISTSGNASASASTIGMLDADAMSDVDSDLSVNAGSSLDANTEAQASVEIEAPLGGATFNTGYNQLNSGSQTTFTLFQNTPGAAYGSFISGAGSVGLAAQNSGQLNLNTYLAGSGSSLISSLPNTSAFSLTGASFQDSLFAKTLISGHGITASTTGSNAPAFNTMLFAEKTVQSNTQISSNAFRATTSGQNSAAFQFSLRGNGQATNILKIDGSNAAISTQGDGAFGISSLVSSGTGDATQRFQFAGNDLSISTTGDRAYGMHAATLSQSNAANTVSVEGSNASISTDGQGSTAMSLWSVSQASANNEINLAGNHARVATNGDGSHAIASIASGVAGSSNQLNIAGHNAAISTQADGAIGYLSLVSDLTHANSRFTMAGANGKIETAGANGHGILAITVGNWASSDLLVSGAGSRISTSGDNAIGVSSIALGDERGASFLRLLGSNILIETAGTFSTGAYLGSSGIQEATNRATINGQWSRIVTRGGNSSGITFAGPLSELSLIGNGSGVFTFGASSHGILFDSTLSTVFVGPGAAIKATGPNSDGIFIKPTASSANIQNVGHIYGQRNGINSAGAISARNYGSITGMTGSGMVFDRGGIFNTGRILGPSALVARQLTDGSVIIDTPGEIASLGGASGTAIELQGAGDDTLIISPFTTLIGSINMGAGDDTLIARRGTNADLTVASPFETIDAGRSLVTLLNAGNRVLIADPSLHINATHLFSEQFSKLLDYRSPGTDHRTESREMMECSSHLGIEFGATQISQDSTGVDSSLHGLMIEAGSDPCGEKRLTANAGYFQGSGQAGSAKTENLTVFGAGTALAFDISENSAGSVYINGGIADGDIGRRIINNTLDTGFEYGWGSLDGWFANIGSTVWNTMAMPNYTIAPFAGAELGFVDTASIDESDPIAGLDIASHASSIYRLAAGVDVSGNEIPLTDSLFAQFGASLGASYSDTINRKNVKATLGNTRHNLNASGPSEELSVDIGAKMSLWAQGHTSKAEIRFQHQESSGKTSANMVTGSLKFYF